MGFPEYEAPKYPRRQWLIEGEPETGKSTFVARLKSPILFIDADHRMDEVAHLAQKVHRLSNEKLDNVDPDKIAQLVTENIKGSGVETIVVDSLTAIISPLVVKAFRDNIHGKNKNMVAAYAEKATAMRILQEILTGTGCDVAWVYHIVPFFDSQAKAGERTSIPTLELSRVLRSCNMRLRLLPNWQIEVTWCRSGRDGFTLQDHTGTWEGMPEKIEEACYNGLTEEEKEKKNSPPPVFYRPEDAIRWASDQVNAEGEPLFNDEAHAKNAYELLKSVKLPTSAGQMRDLWLLEIEARQSGSSTMTPEEREAVKNAGNEGGEG